MCVCVSMCVRVYVCLRRPLGVLLQPPCRTSEHAATVSPSSSPLSSSLLQPACRRTLPSTHLQPSTHTHTHARTRTHKHTHTYTTGERRLLEDLQPLDLKKSADPRVADLRAAKNVLVSAHHRIPVLYSSCTGAAAHWLMLEREAEQRLHPCMHSFSLARSCRLLLLLLPPICKCATLSQLLYECNPTAGAHCCHQPAEEGEKMKC